MGNSLLSQESHCIFLKHWLLGKSIHIHVLLKCFALFTLFITFIWVPSRRLSKGTQTRELPTKNETTGASLVAQWLGICLPMQGTRVQALVREVPRAAEQLSPWATTTEPALWSPRATSTEPKCHNYWACALELACHNYQACVPQLLKPAHLEPVLCNKRSHRNEKPVQDPTQTKIKIKNK